MPKQTLEIWSEELLTGDVIQEVKRDDDRRDIFVVTREVSLDLPTAPYTVIRSTWKDSGGVADFEAILLRRNPPWPDNRPQWELLDDGGVLYPEELAEQITDFKVIALPITEISAN